MSLTVKKTPRVCGSPVYTRIPQMKKPPTQERINAIECAEWKILGRGETGVGGAAAVANGLAGGCGEKARHQGWRRSPAAGVQHGDRLLTNHRGIDSLTRDSGIRRARTARRRSVAHGGNGWDRGGEGGNI